jgi:hypothetical protein
MFPRRGILGNQLVTDNTFPWIRIRYITGNPDENGVNCRSEQNKRDPNEGRSDHNGASRSQVRMERVLGSHIL